jgi:hypothetical protein
MAAEGREDGADSFELGQIDGVDMDRHGQWLEDDLLSYQRGVMVGLDRLSFSMVSLA